MRRAAILIALLIGAQAPASRGAAQDTDLQWSEPAPLAWRSLLLDVVDADGRLVAVGERGHVLVSADRGDTWTQAKVPTRSMLTGVAAAGQHLWAVGHDAVIVHSADQGTTWTRQYFAPEKRTPLLDVWFGDARHGLAIGAYALALATDDGGATWTPVTVDTEEERHLNAIVATPDGTLYIAAEGGTVFRSDDRGRTWSAFTTPYTGSLFGALTRDDAILVVGLRGHVLRSDDRGENWTTLDTGSEATLLSGTLLPDGTVMIVGLSAEVLMSRDGRRGFTGRNLPDRRGIAAALALDAERILLAGEGGLRTIRRADLEALP